MLLIPFLLLLFASTSAAKEEDKKDAIDRVLHVDTGPTQLVVVTSKEGPVDALTVKIELTDILDGRTNPPFVATGLWMLVNRGRYTIPFLRPDRWYGVHFTSERGFGENRISHSEYRLVKTPPRTGNGLVENTQNEDETREQQRMFDVRMHRAGPEHTANVEGVYVTVRWTGKERVNGSELAVELRVKCDSSVANEDIVLPYNQEGVTVEIAMDHKYELEEVNATSHQMMANITPLRCHQICWRPWLRTTADSKIFSKDFGEQCHDVGGTTSTTFLRNFKYYTLHDGVLVVETEHHKSGEVDEGTVVLTAVPIGGGRGGRNESDTFSTEQTDGKFALHLDDPGYYAVTYQYTKLKPFHYSTEERFLVESEGRNTSDPLRPIVELRYEPHSLVQLPKPHTTDTPSLLLYRPPEYEGTDVDVHIEPFCGGKREKVSIVNLDLNKITLTDAYQHHEIEPLLLKKSLCRQQPGFYFCESSWANETLSTHSAVAAAASEVVESVRSPLNASITAAEEAVHDLDLLAHEEELHEKVDHHQQQQQQKHSDLHRSRHRRDTVATEDTVVSKEDTVPPKKDIVSRKDTVTRNTVAADACSPLVCYTVEVEVDEHKYAMGSRCSDVTQHFDMVTTRTSSTMTVTASLAATMVANIASRMLLIAFLLLLFTASTSAKDEKKEDAIVRVLHVDTGPTQLVVVTSKEGPVDALTVKIELTDILDGRTNPPFIATGLWMLVNRGRYTIPFLRPDRWYGVHFTSERGFGENRMDHKYELEEVNATSHQMMAKITPLRCHQSDLLATLAADNGRFEDILEGFRICWRPWLRTTADSKIFSKDFGVQCHDVGGTTSTTFLRNFKYYTLHDGILVVETEHHKSGEVDEGTVVLTAVPIGGGRGRRNESEMIREVFSTEQTDGKFALHLDDPGYYAVTYQYTKLKPFHYSTEERFLVESEGRNTSDPLRPIVELRYEPHSLVELPKPHTTDPPSLLLYRPPEYEGTDVDVYIEPFCGGKREKITLTDAYQHHEIEPLLLKKSLCRQQPGFYFCESSWANETLSMPSAVTAAASEVVESARSSLNASISAAEEAVHDLDLLAHGEEKHEKVDHHQQPPSKHSDLHRSRHRRDTVAAEDTVVSKSDTVPPKKDTVSRKDTVTRPTVAAEACAPLVCYTVEVEVDRHKYAMGSRCSDVTQHFDMITTRTSSTMTMTTSLAVTMVVMNLLMMT